MANANTTPNEPADNSNAIQDKARTEVTRFMGKSRDFRRRHEDLWMRFLGEYLNTRNVKANPLQRANLKLPYAFTTVETFVPQIVETFLSEKPYITAEVNDTITDPAMIMDFTKEADSISSYFSYQLDQMKFFKEFIPFTKNLLIYGTAIAKTTWATKYEKVTKRKETIDEYGIPKTEKFEADEVTYDGPKFDNIDILDFFPDWGASKPGDIQSMRGCVHRVYRTFDELKKLEKRKLQDGTEVGIYSNLDQLKDAIATNGGDAWVNMKNPPNSWSQTQRSFLLNQEPGIKNFDKIEVWEYWGEFELKKGKGKEPCVITLANGNIVIRVDKNPFDYKFKPFIAAIDYVVPGEFYGMGEIEIVYSLIKEATALRNARLDQANQAVNRMWIVDRNSGINVRNLYSRSGGIVLTNDMNGIRELDVAEVPGSGYKETSQIDYDIQNATSQINASQAASGNAARAFGNTAKGVGYLESYSATRLSLKVRQIETWLMEEYGQILLMLNRQFTRKEQWIQLFKVDDNPFIKLSPSSFQRKYNFHTTGAMERLNKQQRQQILTNSMIPFLQTVEQAQPHTINMEGLTKRFFKEFDYQNINELVNTPEVRQQLTEQDQQMQERARAEQQDKQIMAELSLQDSEQAAKSAREATMAQNKAKTAIIKGLFDVSTATINKSE